MVLTRRIVWGHALVRLGVLVRAVSAPLALAALLVLVLAAATPTSLGAGVALTLAGPAIVLVAGRLLAVCLGGLGWMTFPADHRQLLSELASRVGESESTSDASPRGST